MDLMQNLEGPMGFFKAHLKSCNRGPQFSYDEAVDVYSCEPYCYNPALFTAGGSRSSSTKTSTRMMTTKTRTGDGTMTTEDTIVTGPCACSAIELPSADISLEVRSYDNTDLPKNFARSPMLVPPVLLLDSVQMVLLTWD